MRPKRYPTLAEYYAEYRTKNKDKAKEYAARYYLENKEKFKEAGRKSRARNPERTRAREAKWRTDNPERMKVHRSKWEAANGEAYKPIKKMKESVRNATPEGRSRRCAQAKKYRAKYPEKVRSKAMEWHYRSKYGITVAERDQLFEAQEKRCRICQTDKPKGRGFHVDHCHSTQKIRGILCHHCNLILGHSQDSVAILEAAIAYLKGSQ